MSLPLSYAAMCPVRTARRFYGCRTVRSGDGGRRRPAVKGRCTPACVRRQVKQARRHCRDTQAANGEAGAALPYLTNGNVATETPENAETEGQIWRQTAYISMIMRHTTGA